MHLWTQTHKLQTGSCNDFTSCSFSQYQWTGFSLIKWMCMRCDLKASWLHPELNLDDLSLKAVSSEPFKYLPVSPVLTAHSSDVSSIPVKQQLFSLNLILRMRTTSQGGESGRCGEKTPTVQMSMLLIWCSSSSSSQRTENCCLASESQLHQQTMLHMKHQSRGSCLLCERVWGQITG